MSTATAVWKNGQVVLDIRADWPEGRRLVVHDEPDYGFEFMTEEEQSSDPAAIQQWIDDLRSIPPLPEDPEKEASRLAWQAKVKAANIEAVRKQFEEGIS